MSIGKRYHREGINGLGFLCQRPGMLVHVIAWENGEVDRFRDGSDNMASVSVENLDGKPDPEPIKEPAIESETMTQPVGEQPAISWAPVPGDTEAASIRSYITSFGIEVENKQVIDALASHGIVVNSSQVSAAKKSLQKS